MRAFATQALRDVNLESIRDGLVVLTAAVPSVPIDRFAAVFAPAGVLMWDPDGLESDGWSFVGVGEALRIDAVGEDRVRSVRDLAQRALASIVERRAGDVENVPPLRLFGGLSFSAQEPEGPWAGFGQASFVLPRWLYGRRGYQAFLRVALRPQDLLEPDRVLAEISALVHIAEAGPTATASGSIGRGRLEELPFDQWSDRVTSALDRIRQGAFEKVVAARRSLLTAERIIDIAALLQRMGTTYADSARFAMARAGAVFVGATPERLVSRRGTRVESDALAGSLARRPGEDEADVRELLASSKDLREHAPVVAGIRAALEPFCESIQTEDGPRVRSLRSVHHLWTPVTAKLATPAHVLDLVQALHPTPAVCGQPRGAALEWVTANEPEGRGWYAAPVGWFDAEGDGTFLVAIRSALVRDHLAWLYAGAGIVEGSDPLAEYQETTLKQGTMLAALGAHL